MSDLMMSPEEMLTRLRVEIAAGNGLPQEYAHYLLARYDEAIINQNNNADGMQKMAKQCREARHVADLVIAVLEMYKNKWTCEGIRDFLGAIKGKYPWLIK